MVSFPSKPLGIKNYGHIPHLPGSRMGPGEHHCDPGQARIATKTTRDRHDTVIVLEKLDGLNVGVARVDGTICPLNIRSKARCGGSSVMISSAPARAASGNRRWTSS
jgi:hypothetical protein